MNRLNEAVKKLEEKYKIDIDDVMDLYKRKLSRENIAERLGTSIFTMRQVFDQLGLTTKKAKRAENYLKFYVELNADKENAQEIIDAPVAENEYLTKKLGVTQRALIRSRDEANFLRRTLYKSTRKDSIEERVTDIIEAALPIKDKREHNIILEASPVEKYRNYTSSIILSDLHAEEAVTRKDVGALNEFDWKIMEGRLYKLFSEWFNQYRGESRGMVMILGDVISGIIHDTLEHTTKPTAEAVHDLADILSGYFNAAAAIFDTVDIHFVSGNHERISERIKSNSKGMDFGYLFAQILKAKLTGTANVSVNISTTGFVATKVGDKWVGGHHGDNFRGAKSDIRTANIQEAFKQVLQVDVWHVFEGHVHKFSWHNTNRGASVVNGSLIGSNAYGLTNGYMAVRPSQTIVAFDPTGEIDFVKQVFLD